MNDDLPFSSDDSSGDDPFAAGVPGGDPFGGDFGALGDGSDVGSGMSGDGSDPLHDGPDPFDDGADLIDDDLDSHGDDPDRSGDDAEDQSIDGDEGDHDIPLDGDHHDVDHDDPAHSDDADDDPGVDHHGGTGAVADPGDGDAATGDSAEASDEPFDGDGAAAFEDIESAGWSSAALGDWLSDGDAPVGIDATEFITSLADRIDIELGAVGADVTAVLESMDVDAHVVNADVTDLEELLRRGVTVHLVGAVEPDTPPMQLTAIDVSGDTATLSTKAGVVFEVTLDDFEEFWDDIGNELVVVESAEPSALIGISMPATGIPTSLGIV